MTKQELHDEIERLVPGDKYRSTTRMLLHSLVELGVVVELRCDYGDDCLIGDQISFSPWQSNVRTQRDAISVDHRVNLALGGSDMPDNLCVMHLACNVSRGTRSMYQDPVEKAKRSDALKRRWERPEYREKMTKRVVGQQERDKRAESMRQHWADKEKRAKHQEAMRRNQDQK